MSFTGQIRIRTLTELQSPSIIAPSKEAIECNTTECVDLTDDDFTTPIRKNVPATKRTTHTQSKASVSEAKAEPISQTKLDVFFKIGSAVKKAPKKLKRHLESAVKDDSTSVVVNKRRTDLRKLSLRRKLIKVDEVPKKDKSPTVSEENEKPIPTMIPDVVDLCADSDSEDDKPLSKLLMIPKRPLSVNSEKSICPSYKVVDGTTFAVDAFRFGRIEGVTMYFLTHFHADHYIGLTRKFSMPIYASQITANLMREFIPVDEKLVNILHLNETITIDGVQITAIDANHCPGALMILFQLPCGKRILHTGDFRACLEMEVNPHLIQRNIDILYLDTTYISNKYSFQTQAKSISEAIQLIREFREKRPDKRVLYVCGAYLIGKEKFWSPIAKEFDFKVWTDDKRRKVMKAIGNDEILQMLVANPRQADLHVISLMKIGYKGIYDYWKEFSNEFDMIFAIRPSGWEKNSKPQYRGEINVIGVEYSEHSSHAELRRFLAFLKPREVISTVPLGKDATKCSDVPLSWYRKECFIPIKKQASIFSYLEVKSKE